MTRYFVCGFHVTTLIKFGVVFCLMYIGMGILMFLDTAVNMRRQYTETEGEQIPGFDVIVAKVPIGSLGRRGLKDAEFFGVMLMLHLIPMLTRYFYFFLPLQIYWSFSCLHTCYRTVVFYYEAFKMLQNEWYSIESDDYIRIAEDDPKDFFYLVRSLPEYYIIFDTIVVASRLVANFLCAYIVERVMEFYQWDGVLNDLQDWTYDNILHFYNRVCEWVYNMRSRSRMGVRQERNVHDVNMKYYDSCVKKNDDPEGNYVNNNEGNEEVRIIVDV
ncbi:unnamed protein product [Bursaphelenchus okinawaensis]|uniref:Uncharacterized protein n=1 Tax=Bursaphelenchus okinawaensis TaxID=465554 RepID=A0A811KY35_9BILA|nr:unnamed protein product [Bursaphelenchus okinawaensis]CAG9113728.1 unnamed protein product [Bursaphelenchus okinawaensis]